MSSVSDAEQVARLRAVNARLRELLAARDAEIEAMRGRWDTELGELRAQGLRMAELERQRDSGSDDSGTPSSKEPIAAKARRKAERRARKDRDTDTSWRQRSAQRFRGGQPGHPGHGLARDPDPQHREHLDPPSACRACGTALGEVADAGTAWSQCWDVRVIPWRTEYLLPRRRSGCGTTTTATAPSDGPVNGICFGPVLNTAAVALTAFGNVCATRRRCAVRRVESREVRDLLARLSQQPGGS